jgi:hypothetical protein
MPFPLMAAANIASGLISGITGLSQQHKARKMLNKLQFPTEQMPKEYIENQNLARQQAATGLPSEQYTKAMRDIQRQQLTALRGANDRRGGLGILGGLTQATNDATLNLNAQDAQMRLANQRNLMNVNSQVAGVKRSLFDVNQRAKYNQDYSYGMGLLGAGNQNFTGGLDKIATGALGLFGGGIGGGQRGQQNNPYQIRPNYGNYTNALPDVYPDQNSYGDYQ